ncbi:uncharacterized protein LOC119976060 isoform X1 [Scyliorhinus canicula]|uniref:uncharacterized protein LOC119976060 isoform X1 n=1 Tax=Scyliorhinus canicula TaxID=7830 RepID=UPI0018F313BC|nr:uncharacterized protein LOC119976060 isoform X1 [Scyliorhinus canicula]
MGDRVTLWDLSFISLFLCEAAGRKVVFGVAGSSVLLDPKYGADLHNSEVIWTFSGSNGIPLIILDYVPNYPKAEPNEHFRSRLYFNASNGSLMLNYLKASDQGIYAITVGGDWNWSTDLELIEPLSEPFINETKVNTTIELTCSVSVGEASSIVWWKDNKVITNGQRYQLVQNNSTLIISQAKGSDCGNYICTMENLVSKTNCSYTLILPSFPPLHYTMGLFVAALTTAVPAFSCTIISFLPDPKSIIRGYLFLQYVLQAWQFIQMLSFFLFIGALLCWIWVEGLHGITLCMLVLFSLLLISSILSICITACDRRMLPDTLKTKCGSNNPKHRKRKMSPRPDSPEVQQEEDGSGCVRVQIFPVLLSLATAVGEICVMGLSAFFIEKLNNQADKGCEPVANQQTSIILAVVVPSLFLLAILAISVTYKTWTKLTDVKTSEDKRIDLTEQFKPHNNHLPESGNTSQ